MSVTTPLTLTTSGTAQALATRGTVPSNSITGNWCASVDIEVISAPSSANIYIGTQPPTGVSSAVTSSNYNIKLDGTTKTSITLGLGNDDCNDIDLSLVYAVGDQNTCVIAINPKVV